MGFNSAFKGLKLLKEKPGNGRLNNLNDPVLNVLSSFRNSGKGKGGKMNPSSVGEAALENFRLYSLLLAYPCIPAP